MVGQHVTQVYYKGSTEISQCASIHEVDQAVVISTESTTTTVEWRIDNFVEFLSVTDSADGAATTAINDAVEMTQGPPWSQLLGSAVTGFGVATQPSEAGDVLLWALRMDFGSGASVVVALGDLQDAAPRYQPDSLLVISDPEMARYYEVLGATESAWGRDLHW
ncbi:hypothetical protein [Kribbella sp. NPDC050470]|uniref:hypothetical protein n=1 Tax=unclassified Kribbella TaxID=2644121 RepID=UPI0037A0C759